jgi:aryl-phospho-beta-D-glucosidase BglC (GH1 family)
LDDFRKMAEWHANVVRIALNQDFWLSGAALHDPSYEDRIDGAVRDAEAAGLDVILDLHWSDRGNLAVDKLKGQNQAGTSNQQQMADQNSKQFWSEVAAKYKDDGHVLFELYNEPNKISWDVWLNGGIVDGYTAVGMQALYGAVRGTGADNLVIAGGLNWAFNLSAVEASPIDGYNILYAAHPYDKSDDAPNVWETSFGYLGSQDIAPVILTEFGDPNTKCTGAWDSSLIAYADARHISWTAWAWYPSGCSFPALISDWSYTTTVQGDVVKAALLGYSYAPAGRLGSGRDGDASVAEGGGARDSGAGGTSSEAGSPSGGIGVDAGRGGASGAP